MQSTQAFRELSGGTIKRQRRALWAAVVLAFACELLSHTLLLGVRPLTSWQEELLEAALLVALLFPALYFLLFLPNAKHANTREAMESALVEAEAKYRNLVETSQNMIWRCDAHGRFTFLNAAWESVLGYTRADMLGRPFSDFQHHAQAVRDREEFGRHLAGGAVVGYETVHVSKSGEDVVLLFNARPLYDGTMQVIGTQGTATDITRRKRAEAALVSALHDKDALLLEVHHRVKNNLQVIASLLRLERARSAQLETQAVLSDMEDRIGSLALLHEALYRSGTFASVDLGEYLGQLAVQSFRTSLVTPGAVQLRMALTSASVTMDQALPCGLLVNELISNSVKHGFPNGRSGEIHVELQVVDGGPQLRLSVGDTGVGLPADFALRRGHSMGLQLVSELVRQLGGTLNIGPEPAAVFEVTFTPMHAKQAENPA